jgi:hypothetical protein
MDFVIKIKNFGEKRSGESEGGQKFLPPNPLPFCPPERLASEASRSVRILFKMSSDFFQQTPPNFCPFHQQARYDMSTIVWVDEALVHGGKKIHVGDMVDLVPPDEMYKHPDKNPDEELHFNRRSFANERRWLGEGPYTVAHIGRWPCGRLMVYVKTKTSSGAGVYARDLMPV